MLSSLLKAAAVFVLSIFTEKGLVESVLARVRTSRADSIFTPAGIFRLRNNSIPSLPELPVVELIVALVPLGHTVPASAILDEQA
ncbi:hypothetical protein D3C81_1415570 [compost metagenome]